MPTDGSYIDQTEELIEFCRRATEHSWIAIDTEFLREKTYYSQLCLIQIATQDEIACIDPLSIDDLAPLNALMTNTSVLKVMHSGGQDMETLYQTLGSMPTPVFDTQTAAALLGEGEQISYAGLVKSLLDIELPKSQTRTNWAKRPLTESQLAYAADDVRYLRDVYLKEVASLKVQNRLEWATQESRKLENVALYEPEPSGLLKKVKGQHLLPLIARAVVYELANWRELLAREKNLPRKWIIPDQVLLDLGTQPVTDVAALAEIPSLTEKQITRYGEQLVTCTKSALAYDESHWQSILRRTHITPAQQAEVKRLQKIVEQAATEHNIAQSLIASRKELEHYVLDGADIPVLHGWRLEVVGPLPEPENPLTA